jgi:hypothetical protein
MAENPRHRFMIVRSRRDGSQQEFPTHRHAAVMPGDVLEVVRIVDHNERTHRPTAASVQ